MKKIAIIHFAPLELYPPVQNLLRTLEFEKIDINFKVRVFTTRLSLKHLDEFQPPSSRINLVRLGRSDAKRISLIRYWNYFIFFGGCVLSLIWYHPSQVLYFETISSWPVFIYKRFFKRDCEILIHYHEYTTPGEYKRGMKLTDYFHKLEKKLYPCATWVSHTNSYRVALFQKDILPLKIKPIQILPNYPPKKWKVPAKQTLNFPLKIVYVGALSLSTMYTKEFVEWVISKKGKVTLDIFSFNCTDEAWAYLQKMKLSWIQFHEGVNYDQLPAVLIKFDIGVILYNAHIPNYEYNAPNKLFEYLACGLDVWFPEVITGCKDYVNEYGFPKVLPVDFTNFNKFDVARAMERNGSENPNHFFCEEALRPLIHKLCFHD